MEKQNFKGVPESNWVVGPCQTEEIAKQVLAVAHAYGWKWSTGDEINPEQNNWRLFAEDTHYNLAAGKYGPTPKKNDRTIISPETFLANNPMPIEKPEEKTRKPGVKYTLEDWKKEADSCRKRAEYWKNKFQEMETRHFTQSGNLLGEMDAINEELENLKAIVQEGQLHLKWSNEANKALKESNVELKGANDELIKNLDHLRERLELQTKGVKALEEDAKVYRTEIHLLKKDFNILKADHEELIHDHEDLLNIQKWTKVVGWVGWIGLIFCMAFIMFYKG